jgi:very-short-patch-repair endonuclease
MNSDDQKNFAQTDNPNIQDSFGEVDSAFEADVVNFIKGNIKPTLPVKVIKQYEVGSFAIDIALLDQKNNFIIGIEVDGYDYHLGAGFDKYLSDLSRQEFLESKGYDIYRVSEIDFKINRDKIKYELTSILRNKLPSLIPVEGQKAENFNMQ